ncbi:MAG: lysophospholipid acyltransferase family protein [Planctomycetes bacterium]|nr:lysophospholipid acyltransferase family protein [Planctomycetota bacterium]
MAKVLALASKAVFFTLRVVSRDDRSSPQAHEECASGEPKIFACWHRDLAFAVYFVSRLKQTAASRFNAMISPSRDGLFASEAIAGFGINTIFGSSARDGASAILQGCQKISAGFHVVVALDGPRGPAFGIKDGIFKLSQLSGAPIIPLGFACSRCHTLNSWDGFRIPLPFSKTALHIGSSMQIVENAPRKDFPELREILGGGMLECTISAEACLNTLSNSGSPVQGQRASLPTCPPRG